MRGRRGAPSKTGENLKSIRLLFAAIVILMALVLPGAGQAQAKAEHCRRRRRRSEEEARQGEGQGVKKQVNGPAKARRGMAHGARTAPASRSGPPSSRDRASPLTAGAALGLWLHIRPGQREHLLDGGYLHHGCAASA